MPDGVVQWFDPSSGEGVIRRGGRRYAVRAEDMESTARVGGARVHFDVVREDGGLRAERVTLRVGTRVHPRQSRFGDLSGGRAAAARRAAEEQRADAGEEAPQETGEPEEAGDLGTVEISSSGVVRASDLAYAEDKIGKVLDDVGRPVLHTDIRLEKSADPSVDRPAMARVIVLVDGEPVRASVQASEVTEAIDLLDARLRRRLAQMAEVRQALRRRGPTSPTGQWRRGDAPTERPPYLPRPAADREIVRRKAFTTAEATIDEAIFDLESLDHDFFLFTDLASGQDAVVHRRDDGSYGLQFADGAGDDPLEPTAAAVEVDPDAAARHEVDDAREHLDMTGAPWLFFVDPDDERGHILYRRLDGHYGLITPAG